MREASCLEKVPLKKPLLPVALAPLCRTVAPSLGPFSRTHQHLEDGTKCASCHDFEPGTGNRSCKRPKCQVDIQNGREAHAGYHAREYKNSGETNCARCSADHNGGASFLGCRRASASVNWRDAAAGAENFTFGALRQYHFGPQTCETCQSDPHQTTLPCESRHMTEPWKTMRAFDRSATKCDEGRTKVKRGDCHMGTTPQFPSTGEQCGVCHLTKDIRAGRFRRGIQKGEGAASHVTAHREIEDFNHDRTRFQLDVARNVACEKSHREQSAAAGKMLRTGSGAATECAQCH